MRKLRINLHNFILQIKKFNLELALFVKELHSHTENVNEIDDETTKLLIETILAVDKLQATSKIYETSSTNDNQFLNCLNEEIFKIRRHIICCLCHVSINNFDRIQRTQMERFFFFSIMRFALQEQIPLNSEDFELHTQKTSHKEKEIKLNASRHIPVGGTEIGQAANELIKSTSLNAVNSNDNNQMVIRAKSQDTIAINTSIISHAGKLEKAIATEMIDFVSRTQSRIDNEVQILKSLIAYLNAFDSELQLVPFGSSTYGYGGSRTNFNILAYPSEIIIIFRNI